MASELLVDQRQANRLITLIRTFARCPGALKVTGPVVGKSQPCVGESRERSQLLRLRKCFNRLWVAPHRHQGEPERLTGIRVEWIEHYRAPCRGGAGLGLAHFRGEHAVLSQQSCIAGRKRHRTVKFLSCAAELEG